VLADGEQKSVKDICRLEHIPEQYAYKILKKLESGGFLKSHRGRNGGYCLIKSPEMFNIFDIISTVNSDISLFECLRENYDCPNNKGEAVCAVHSELERLQACFIKQMQSKTMAQIINSSENKLNK